MRFNSLDDIRAFCRDLPKGDAQAADAAALRQQNLTKPPGSLGRLEELAIWLARWQGNPAPRLDRVTIAVFAGNHGIAARGVSAYPAEVTAQMVANFAAGGRRSTRSPRWPAPNSTWFRSNSSGRHATSRLRRRWIPKISSTRSKSAAVP